MPIDTDRLQDEHELARNAEEVPADTATMSRDPADQAGQPARRLLDVRQWLHDLSGKISPFRIPQANDLCVCL